MTLMIRIWTSLIVFFALQSVAHGETIPFKAYVDMTSMTQLYVKIQNAYVAGDRNITLELNSGGGRLEAALWIAPYLKKYGVNTYVKEACSSACTVLFAAGHIRSASDEAQFMFHAVGVDIGSKLKYNKKKNPNGIVRDVVAADFAARWMEQIREASPILAERLAANNILVSGKDTYYSGYNLRKTGYVND